MKRKAPQHENHERWLVSYADFITLLFAFFVVMFASSQTDKTKAKQVSDSVKEALETGSTSGIPPIVAKILGGTVDDKGIGNAQMKGPGGANKIAKETKEAKDEEIEELLPPMKKLTSQLQKEIKDGKLEMHLENRGLVISLREATFFPSGDDVVSTKSFVVIDKLVGVIHDLPNALSIEGHTDSIPIHTVRFNSNWELSAARSIAMLNLLHSHYGLDTHRLSIVGYADTQPLAENDTEERRARNRRVDVVIRNMTVVAKNEKNEKKPETKPSPAAAHGEAKPSSHK